MLIWWRRHVAADLLVPGRMDREARRGMGGGMGRKQGYHNHKFIRGICVADRAPFGNAMANVAIME